MAVTAQRLKGVLGEDGFDELLSVIESHFVTRDEYREIISRFDLLEKDVTQLRELMDERFREVNKCLDRLELRLDNI